MIELLHADIATLAVDAIVNAANSALAGGGGVDGAIHRAAGPELARAAMRLAPCAPGDAVITPGFRLPARFVIHAVGPVWRGGQHGEARVLQHTYERAFAVAATETSIRSIAFPAISTGVYRFPKREAASIALGVMREHESQFDRIIACLFDAESLQLYRELLMPTLTAAEPQLFVRDLAAASEFYSRKLGFSVAFMYGEPPFYGQVVRDGARLNFRQVDDAALDAIRRATDQFLSATITLEDARPLFAEYQRAGVEFAQPLKTEPWGAITFMVRDPDGNLLLFAGRGV